MANISKLDLFREKKLSQYAPAGGRLPVDGSGVTQPVSIIESIDPTLSYKITDIDPTEGNSYFGYTEKDGKWYIMKLTSTSARYIKGDSGYLAAWAGKDGLNYDYYYNIF